MNVECEMIYLNPSKGLRFINKKIITKIPATPFWFYSNLQSRSGGLPRHRVILEQPRLYGLAGIGVSSVGNFGVGYGYISKWINVIKVISTSCLHMC